ncbi:MAG TPA: hypothetical protein VGB95_01605, partial [Chitinophagales bacterium]
MRYIACICALFLLLTSCRKDDKTNWDTNLLAPLASTSLSISDLVKDSLAEVNSDNTVNLVFRSTIYELNLADQYIHIPDTSIGQTVRVDSMAIAEIPIIYIETLGQLAYALSISSNPLQQYYGNYLLSNIGNTITIPAINGFALAPITFDASTYFETMTLSQGTLDYFLTNHLPIPITNLIFIATNHNTGTVIVSDTVPYIAPYDSVYRITDLAGKTVDGQIDFAISNFNSPGSTSPVLVDTNDYIKLRAKLYHLRASRAIARFPSQDIISTAQEITNEIGDRKFTFINCESGNLNVNISSSISENFRLTYRLKGAYDKYGHSVQTITNIAAATPGNPTIINQNYDLSGYSIGLTGSLGNKFNTYTQVVIAHIDSTGVLREISNTDSVYITYRLQ